MKLPRSSDASSSFVAFSGPGGSSGGIDQIPEDAILEYVRDMCVTLAYMSNATQCKRLTDLLEAAAAESEKELAAVMRANPSPELSRVPSSMASDIPCHSYSVPRKA